LLELCNTCFKKNNLIYYKNDTLVLEIEKQYVNLNNSNHFVKLIKNLPENTIKLSLEEMEEIGVFWILNFLYQIQKQDCRFIIGIEDFGIKSNFINKSYFKYSTFGVIVDKTNGFKLIIKYDKTKTYAVFCLVKEYLDMCKKSFLVQNKYKIWDDVTLFDEINKYNEFEICFSAKDFNLIKAISIKLDSSFFKIDKK